MKYCMYVVDSNNDDFEKSQAGYDDVKNSAIDCEKSDDIELLLRILICGLNSDRYSDQNWYFITDEQNGIILMG